MRSIHGDQVTDYCFLSTRLINRLRSETSEVPKEEMEHLAKGIEEAEKESANVQEVFAQ